MIQSHNYASNCALTLCAPSQFSTERSQTPAMSIDFNQLDEIPLLAELGLAERQRIAGVVRPIALSKRQIVIEKASQSQGLWILLNGRLQGIDYTIDGREVGLYFIDPKQFFGELALIDSQPHPEHIIATAPSEVLLIPTAVCRDLMKFHPQIATQIATTLASRVRGLIRQRTLLTLTTPAQRLAAQLIDLAETAANSGQIEFIPTHQELAMMINSSRETVTRTLRTLHLKGIVRRQGSALIIANRKLLEALAKGDGSD